MRRWQWVVLAALGVVVTAVAVVVLASGRDEAEDRLAERRCESLAEIADEALDGAELLLTDPSAMADGSAQRAVDRAGEAQRAFAEACG